MLSASHPYLTWPLGEALAPPLPTSCYHSTVFSLKTLLFHKSYTDSFLYPSYPTLPCCFKSKHHPPTTAV